MQAEAKPIRILHTMLRVADLDRSLAFYVGQLGMRLQRREEYPEGRFTLAFVGYGDERTDAVIELTQNWDRAEYEHGNAFGHVALAVSNAQQVTASLARSGIEVARPAGLMKYRSPQRDDAEVIAFVKDPDGYRIELVERE